MKEKIIKIQLLEKGDRVFTSSGLATVTKDEEIDVNNFDSDTRIVWITLDEPISNHPTKGEEFEIYRSACNLIEDNVR